MFNSNKISHTHTFAVQIRPKSAEVGTAMVAGVQGSSIVTMIVITQMFNKNTCAVKLCLYVFRGNSVQALSISQPYVRPDTETKGGPTLERACDVCVLPNRESDETLFFKIYLQTYLLVKSLCYPWDSQ